MSKKRRTRAKKKRSQNKLIISSEPIKIEPETTKGKAVKGYFKTDITTIKHSVGKVQNANKSGVLTNLKLIRKDLLVSISVASLILCLEIVLYLFWYK